MSELERTFNPRVVRFDHGDTAFAVDYAQAFFRRNLRFPVLTGSVSILAGRAVSKGNVPPKKAGRGLVAESVNQLLEHGAEPVLSTLTLWGVDSGYGSGVIDGAVQGCREAGCSLAPPRYTQLEEECGAVCYSVGVVDRRELIDSRKALPRDIVLGIQSEGLLPTDWMSEDSGVEGNSGPDSCRLLSREVLEVLRGYRRKRPVHIIVAPGPGRWPAEGSISRGLLSGLERKLGRSLKVAFTADCGELSAPLEPFWPEGAGGIDSVLRTGNCGLGLILVVSPYFARSIAEKLRKLRVKTWFLGRIERSRKR